MLNASDVKLCNIALPSETLSIEAAAIAINASYFLIKKYQREGLLSDPVTQQSIMEYKNRFLKWVTCFKCEYQFINTTPNIRSRCPACKSRNLKVGIHRPGNFISRNQAAKILEVSYQTLLNFINEEYLTDHNGKLDPKEVQAFKSSFRKFHCAACKHEWTRKRLGFPSGCGKCGSGRVMQIDGPKGISTFSAKEWSKLG